MRVNGINHVAQLEGALFLPAERKGTAARSSFRGRAAAEQPSQGLLPAHLRVQRDGARRGGETVTLTARGVLWDRATGAERIQALVREHLDLPPAAIQRDLELRRPIYAKTAAYGHFGREDHDFTWERTDKAGALREAARLSAPAEGAGRDGGTLGLER